jgi:hypothetical protein
VKPRLCVNIIENRKEKSKLNTFMMSFKQYFQQDDMEEEKGDIKKTLAKLPESHAALVKGFQWKFHAGNTLNGDDQHVGYVDTHSKEVAVAAPYNYGREFTILHEIAHRVWERFVAPDPRLVHEWKQIVARTKNKQKQGPEELFCHAYANYYVKNKIVIHDHPEWRQFIANIEK